MEKLPRIIGSAPSELSLEELEQKLQQEHLRVREGLFSQRTQISKGRRVKSSAKSSSLTPKKFLEMLAERGMTLEDFERLSKLEEKENAS